MRSYTASILLALILLAPALTALPAGQQTIVLRPLTLTATFYIEPGDAVAPHLYDWHFDGVDDYVEIAHSDSLNLNVLTVMVWFRSTFLGAWARTIVAKYGYTFISNMWILGWVDNGRLGFVIRDANGVVNTVSAGYGEGLDGSWHLIAGVASDSHVQFWMDGVLKASVGRTAKDIRNTRPVTLGMHAYHYVPVQIAQALVYSRALSDAEIAQAYSGVVSSSGLVLFLDATFYNGTHYIDLSGSGNHGVGYGGVSRVLSDRPHLYLVKGLHGDGLVHFRFFPASTVVDVYDAVTNSPVALFVIDGPANPAGLVEDYAVSLPPGTYRLAVYTSVYVQVAQPSLPAVKFVAAHFKAVFGPGCRVYIDYTAWPKAEPKTECGLQTNVAFLTGLPAGATVRVWNGTVAYELTASSTGVIVLGGLRHGEYEVKVYSDTLQIPHDHLLRLDPLTGLRQFFGFWDRLTYGLFTPVFVVGLVLAVYLRTWSAILTALVALAAHIVLAPDNIWIRGLLALALATAIYIAIWRRTTLL